MRAGIDEVDLALLDGVHVNPRVRFEDLAAALNVSAVTVARRWSRLVDEGRAWVSSAMGPALPMAGALVEAECEPGLAQAVAEQWAAVPQVFSVHLTTGRYNAYGLIAAADDARLAGLLLDLLPATPGVRAVRASTMFRLFSGTYWRLGAISARQAREVAPAPVVTSSHTFDELDRRLYLSLQQDGRLSYRDLAAQLGCSETVARRRVQLLTRSGQLGFRADFARAEAGWPISVVLMLGISDGTSVQEVGAMLVGWPEVRVCAAILGGSAQLLVTVQVHELGALAGITARLRSCKPGVPVLSQRVVLRPVKSFGRLLDAGGRAVGVVPVDPWAEPVAD